LGSFFRAAFENPEMPVAGWILSIIGLWMSSKGNQTIPSQTGSVAALHRCAKCIPKPLYPLDVDSIHPDF